jgi:hypothetical protein
MSKPTHKFAGLIPEMLLRSIRNHRCVLFAGAGLSAQAQAQDGVRPPTWATLLDRMVDWCIDHRVPLRGEPSEFREVIRKGRLLAVAQELQDSIGAQLNSCLAEILYSGKIKPSEAHRLLTKTDWVAALTSNYDGLIEGGYALESGGIVPPVFSPDDMSQALDRLRNDRFFVFKIHGDVNLTGSIVLSNRDYARLLYLSPGYRSFLETVFATYTVLFVGFGGADPDLDGIVDRLSAIYERSIGQHFLLISEQEFTALERRRLLEDKRLDCITYEGDASHSQLVEFLRALSELTAPGVEVEAPFADDRRARVFLSGRVSKRHLLQEIRQLALEAGFDVWLADDQPAVGESIIDVIGKAIDAADIFVAVVSEDASGSSWADFELGRAYGAHKKILPIRVGDARLPSGIIGLAFLPVKGPELTPKDRLLILESLKRMSLDTLRRHA